MFEHIDDGSNNLKEYKLNFACVFGVVLQISSTFTRFISFCIGVCNKIYLTISREKGLYQTMVMTLCTTLHVPTIIIQS
jgi:hypothetical protein